MHSNHIHPIAEADILTVSKLCAKTFVYSGNDDVFSTVRTTPLFLHNDTEIVLLTCTIQSVLELRSIDTYTALSISASG